MAERDIDKSLLSAVLEALPNGVLVTDAQGRVLLLNPAFKRLLELPDDTPPPGHSWKRQ